MPCYPVTEMIGEYKIMLGHMQVVALMKLHNRVCKKLLCLSYYRSMTLHFLSMKLTDGKR